MKSEQRRVSVFTVMPEEGWTSQNSYADRMFSALQKMNQSLWNMRRIQFSKKSFLPDFSVSIRNQKITSDKIELLYSRYLYLLQAGEQQGTINHLLDNSYGHLLKNLDTHRTVTTFHGGTPRTWRDWPYRGPGMKFFDWSFKWFLRSTRIISVSQQAKQEIISETPYDPDRIHVIHHAVDPVFAPVDNETRDQKRLRLRIPVARPVVLHVGMCINRKNLGPLIESISILKNEGLDPLFIQVGGTFLPTEISLIDKFGLRENIRQIPVVDGKDLAEYYQIADVFVFPSLYEGFGVPLIEAMASGLPLVCSDIPLFHEIVADAGIFVDSKNSLAIANGVKTLFSDPVFRSNLRNRGLQRSRVFSWEEHLNALFSVYELIFQELN